MYGMHTVLALLKTDARQIQELRLLRSRNDRRVQKIQSLADAQDIPWAWASRAELDQLVDGNHQGVAALCTSTEVADETYLDRLLANLDQHALLLVLDEITDPHNLGACLRTADAVGVHALITTRDRSAGITPVVRKVASGAADSVPFVVVTNLVRTLERLKKAGIWVIGTDGAAEEVLYDTDMTGPLALVIGAEGKGLRRLTRETCDRLVKLPMHGVVSSLNVSVAAGVCLYEIDRQRACVSA
ncbi:MAG: 23S rRNA (guanosine(2251)-2'-O)-methyltransferase RlmB [Gammaproteobacteria bacterium]|nr:MAG: 23S rRNA (guanosine(2251)-2'-O)-methyltransferase RlmB [Gammaproteobacteria bacterium]RLA49161.1 MAG: 23S rRNA (guanosine(2251)-2'-O)-methyltransferase RlmB [Gammaproteobacteria bacterium]